MNTMISLSGSQSFIRNTCRMRTLFLPSDEEGGKSVYAINEDPKMPVSYGYQFHPKYREEKTEERLIYGDVIPLTRCRHHENQAFDCLNLSFAFKVYPSSGIYTPEEKYGTPKKAIVALEAGLQRLPDSAHSFFSEQASNSIIRLSVSITKPDGRKMPKISLTVSNQS